MLSKSVHRRCRPASECDIIHVSQYAVASDRVSHCDWKHMPVCSTHLQIGYRSCTSNLSTIRFAPAHVHPLTLKNWEPRILTGPKWEYTVLARNYKMSCWSTHMFNSIHLPLHPNQTWLLIKSPGTAILSEKQNLCGLHVYLSQNPC